MTDPTTARVLDAQSLDALIEGLWREGRTVLGPRLRDGAIVYGEVASACDLPAGWADSQSAGRYTLSRRPDEAFFGYAVGPDSWKRFLRPPRRVLWRARRNDHGFTIEQEVEAPAYAFFGVRPCELAAIETLDKVLLQGPYPDPHYAAARKQSLIIAVNCGAPAATCFCTSMGAGPRAVSGFDLALTEILDRDGHRFLVEAGRSKGDSVLAEAPTRAASAADQAAAEDAIAGAKRRMRRSLDTDGLAEKLAGAPEHPRWKEVAERCLACGNCTQVCPTCFCSTVEDTTDLAGTSAVRERRWDSCFAAGFSYLNGGIVRDSGAARYRQWLTHKLSTWHDQFDSSGCVGCGRCIAWCPVGIDLTEEAAAIAGEAGP